MLHKRFGNKQHIIDKHMEVLLSMEAVFSETHLKTLRRLYDTIEAQFRVLKAIGVTYETYGGLLSSVILSKLPPEIRLIISREIGEGDRNLENLMKLLLDELQAREISMAGEFVPMKIGEKTGKSPNTVAALSTGGSGTTPTCCYCQQVQLSHVRRNVTSVDERKCLLREAGRWFVYLRRGHILCQCTS